MKRNEMGDANRNGRMRIEMGECESKWLCVTVTMKLKKEVQRRSALLLSWNDDFSNKSFHAHSCRPFPCKVFSTLYIPNSPFPALEASVITRVILEQQTNKKWTTAEIAHKCPCFQSIGPLLFFYSKLFSPTIRYICCAHGSFPTLISFFYA